jgi:hypothetical protein
MKELNSKNRAGDKTKMRDELNENKESADNGHSLWQKFCKCVAPYQRENKENK